MKLPYGKYGLTVNPIGAQCTLTWEGRELLGDIIGYEWDGVSGGVRLTVRHFNGDLWPLRPMARAVDILERTYEEGSS